MPRKKKIVIPVKFPRRVLEGLDPVPIRLPPLDIAANAEAIRRMERGESVQKVEKEKGFCVVCRTRTVQERMRSERFTTSTVIGPGGGSRSYVDGYYCTNCGVMTVLLLKKLPTKKR